jgi:two-component sensor histidine kinase/integral membrane sensor domain MASE1
VLAGAAGASYHRQDVASDASRRLDLRLAIIVVGLATVYFGAARFGMSLAFATKQVTAVWPPTGIAVAAYVIFGYRVWPGVFVGAFVANATRDEPALAAAAIAVGNTAAGMVGLYLARRVTGLDRAFARVRDVLGLIVFAAAIGSVVSASNGVAALAASGVVPRAAIGSVWWVWWIGDAMGVLVFAPFLLLWTQRGGDLTPARRLEWAGLVIAVAAAGYVALSGELIETSAAFRLEYTVFPFIIWAALRFGQRQAATAGVLISAFAIWGAMHDRGPFAAGTLDERLILLELFMAIAMSTALTLGALATARGRAERALQQANDALEARVGERTAELTGALAEKEVLLKEIHHRVKNNLQVISSLLSLHARQLPDDRQRDVFLECKARVQSIALVHEKLYQSRDYARVPFGDYTRSLASSVFHAVGTSARINLELDVGAVAIAIDRAIPCGLILNELITNALKHGFPGGRAGTIRVELATRPGGSVRLAVSDDGVGLPAEVDAGTATTVGLFLVMTLAEQLGADVTVRRDAGTTFELTFPAG